MKSTWNKKLIIQLLSVGLVRFLFVLVIILMVSFASNLDSQTPKPVLDDKPVTAKVISSQPIEEEYTAAKIEPILPPVKGNKKERLFHPIIIQTSSRHQVDPAIVKAIIMAESGYNPRAISKAGAKGLMQLMPKTAQDLGVEDSFNPQQNISGGVRYFKQLMNRFNGDFKLALAAYNAGSTTVRRYKGVPPFKATKHYIKKVFKYYQLYKNQMTEEVDRA
jgi:soluble lytic murein transglycosylase-like protein